MTVAVNLRARLYVIYMVLGLSVIALFSRSVYLTLGTDSRMRANLTVMNRSPASFVALGKQTEKLQEMSSSIDRYSLGDIKTVLSDTVRLVSEARTEFLAQYDAWVAVKGQTSKDRESFLEFKARLDETRNMQVAEIVRLKKALDESTKPSWFETLGNLVAAFVAGIASSWIASALYSKYERYSKAKELRTRH